MSTSDEELVATQLSLLEASTNGGNPGNAADRGPVFEAISASMFALAFLFVALRIYARLKIQRRRKGSGGVGFDESFAVLALIFSAALTATIVVGVHFGLGKHIQDQTDFGLERVLKLVYADIILIILSLFALRCSILCLYLRMTPVRFHHIIIWTILVITSMHSLAALLVAIFQCVPVYLYWDPINFLSTNKPNCVNLMNMNIANATLSLIWDLTIWLLPLPVLSRLHAPARKKVGIYAVVAISGLAVACAAVRLQALVSFKNNPDITWHLPVTPFVSTIEAFVALITSSIPVIYPLFVKAGKGTTGKSSSQPSEKRWPNQSARASVAPMQKAHAKWSFGMAKRNGEDTELNVFGKESLNTFHEIPSTTNLNEPSEVPSVKSQNQPEATWKAV